MKSVLLALLATQFALVPAFVLSLWATPRRVGLRFAWVLHRVLVVAVLVVPVVCLLPARSLFPIPAVPPASTQVAAAADDAAGTVRIAEGDSVVALPRVPRAIAPSVASALAAAFGTMSAGGAALLAVRFAAQRLRERRMRRRGTIRSFGRLRIVDSPLVGMPFSAGVLIPRVYLPSSFLARSRELRMVLAHEGVHLRRVHYAWTLIEACMAALFWYNPLLVAQCARGRRVRELMCDQVVVTRYASEEYGGFLARAAERAMAMRRHPRFADGWLGRGALAERIRFLLHGGARRSGPGIRVLACTAGVLAGACLLAAVPFLTPVSAGGAPERRPETASTDPFPMVCLMPLLSADAYTKIDDYSRMKAGDPYNRISLDLRARLVGAEVVAATSGRVVEIRHETSGVYSLTMRSDNGFGVLYGNLASVRVKQGERVAAGSTMGTAGPVSEEPAYVDLASYSMSGSVSLTGTITTSGYYTDDFNATMDCVLHFEVDARGFFFGSVSFQPSPAATGAAASRFTMISWVGDGR